MSLPFPQQLRVFMQCDLGRLRAMVDGAFEIVSNTDGVIISSSVNGSSFQLDFANTKLSPTEVLTLAQMAIDAKVRGFQRPITRTVALFN